MSFKDKVWDILKKWGQKWDLGYCSRTKNRISPINIVKFRGREIHMSNVTRVFN